MFVNGFLNLNKPEGISSQQALTRIKKRFKLNRIGHTGTLDPLASGVLCVAINQCTKMISFVDDSTKKYSAGIKFGIRTDTQDILGSIVQRKIPPFNLTYQMLNEILCEFKGTIEQIPPMFSALKKDGKKLYELAREGITIERQSRKCNIYSIELKEFVNNDNECKGIIVVECSRGTYIRTLADDIGIKTGTFACMESLCRLKTSCFDISESYELESLINMDQEEFNNIIIKPADFFNYPEFNIKPEFNFYLLNGQKLKIDMVENFNLGEGKHCFINRSDNSSSGGLYKLIENELLTPLRILN